MSYLPIFIPRFKNRRSPNSSNDDNLMIRELMDDLARLAHCYNDLYQRYSKMQDIFSLENSLMQVYIRERMVPQDPAEIVTVRAQDAYTIGIDDERADVDLSYGFVSLRQGNVTSRLKVGLADDAIVPAETGVSVTPPPSTLVTDQDLRGCLSGEAPWVRKMEFDISDPTSSVTSQVTITLPEHILTSKAVNCITIHPFPVGIVDIHAIEYRESGVFKPVPGFIPMNNAPNLKIYTKSTFIDAIRITLAQRYWVEKSGLKRFFLGLKYVDASYCSFPNTSAKFYVDVPLGETGRTITAITPYYINDLEFPTLLSYNIYTKDPNGNLVYVSDRLPVTIPEEQITLECALNVDSISGTTPQLDRIEVSC